MKTYCITILLSFLPCLAQASEFRSSHCPFTVSYPDRLGKINTGSPKSGGAAFGFLKDTHFNIDIACGNNINKPIPDNANSEKNRVLRNLNLADIPQELLNFQFIKAAEYALTFHSSLQKGDQEMIFLTVEGFSERSLFTMVISVLPGAPDQLVEDLQSILKSVKWKL